jgi:hypothetical protein
MADSEPSPEPTLAERWLQDQQQWQRTLFTYLDSMMKNEEFLVHMGNAMRGSLLAGKPYPTAAPAQAQGPADDPATTDRLDKILFALHQLQGQMKDVLMTLDEIKSLRKAGLPAGAGTAAKAGVKRAANSGKRRKRS